jgi:hypothetical protein
MTIPQIVPFTTFALSVGIGASNAPTTVLRELVRPLLATDGRLDGIVVRVTTVARITIIAAVSPKRTM